MMYRSEKIETRIPNGYRCKELFDGYYPANVYGRV